MAQGVAKISWDQVFEGMGVSQKVIHQQLRTTVCVEVHERVMLMTWNREKSLNYLSSPD